MIIFRPQMTFISKLLVRAMPNECGNLQQMRRMPVSTQEHVHTLISVAISPISDYNDLTIHHSTRVPRVILIIVDF